jgi:hypothetical protein
VTRVLSRSGDSLADIYDVDGSIVSIEELEAREIALVHEMGHNIFSERFSMAYRRETTGAIAQNATWNNTFADLPAGPFRITNVFVFVDTASRITIASIALRSTASGREVPFWTWDTSDDDQIRVRYDDDGAGVATITSMVPVNSSQKVMPHIAAGIGQPQRTEEIVFRGLASAFGAGDVTCTCYLELAFSQVAPGLSSRGLPVPSW